MSNEIRRRTLLADLAAAEAVQSRQLGRVR